MKFFSTNKQAPKVGFQEAVMNSLPPDNGLYFPEHIPLLPETVLRHFRQMSLPEIGYEMVKPFVGTAIESNELKTIMEEVLCFEIPLVEVEENIHSLELFHGPTYAFKDVGARFLARCLGHFSQSKGKETTILVATSGDTGGAVANGFLGIEGVSVIILYPSGKVSDLQEKQLTTLGKNITALEVNGDFDNCQALVKQAFLDKELNQKLNLTSANSINIARWVPQSIYYAWLLTQLEQKTTPVIAVPSGNYGNITAGMLAKKMGFPLGKFLACSNANNIVPRYLATEKYEQKPTVSTYANAMDVSLPSNFGRMQALYNNDYKAICNDVTGFSMSDRDILETIKLCQNQAGYLLDPHGAIGYKGLKTCLKAGEQGVFLETAHPIKFAPTMEKALGYSLTVPTFAKELMDKEKVATKVEANFKAFKELLIAH